MHLRPEQLEVLECFGVLHALRLDEIPYDEAGRPRVSIVAMDEDASAIAASTLDEAERFVEVRNDLDGRHVGDRNALIDVLVGEAVFNLDGDVEDVCDVVVL